ncbi:multidrug ABC transporter permease [Sphingobacteriales bacterium UPWRP_1]|nr:multidrug ABC transporter permease [Sphingobacteriales bacterium UPWRP_1]
MYQFAVFVRKEFYHIWRDKRSLLILFAMPVVLILLFGFALSNEINHARLAVLDFAKDDASRAITQKLAASNNFDIQDNLSGYNSIENAFESGKISLVVVFPQDFQNQLLHNNATSVQVIADASDPNVASVLYSYVSAIIADYQSQLWQNLQIPYTINTTIQMIYNPQLKAAYNFVPGVMSMILLLISAMMTSIAIVREKELGSMEVLLVSPAKPMMVIISKAVPYFFLSFINVCSIIALSVFVLGLPVKGNLALLLAESMLFIFTTISLGLMISNIVQTQQAAMLISLMGFMLPTVMFGGYMFPVENMPKPLQVISNIVPSKWFYYIAKSIMIKGLGFDYVWRETAILAGMTLFFLLVALKNFKIRLA